MTARERITEWAKADAATDALGELELDGEVIYGSDGTWFAEFRTAGDVDHYISSRVAVPAMAAALTAALAKLAEFETWGVYDTRDIGEAFDANSVRDLVSETKEAIETALEES